MRNIYLLILAIGLQSCGTYLNQPITKQHARLGESTEITNELVTLPKPVKPVVVGVYKFRDQTGQYKPTENGSTFSTAITQGATTILIKALEDSKWFIPIERENLSNLLNERNIIRSTRKEYRKTSNPNEPQLPPLLYAGILLEGGIISYDSNIITGGGGARYLGIGGSTQYRQDRVSVYLRAVSTSSGKILKTVYISKTILSQAIDASVFKYVKFKRLLEVETGFTKNEPVHLAVTEAIEKAVETLIIEGIQDRLWKAKASEKEVNKILLSHQIEKEEASSTFLNERFLSERRGKHGLSAALGATLMNGDHPNPKLDFNSRIGYKYFINPSFNASINYNKFNLANKGENVFNESYMSFDFNLEYTLLPKDNFSPFVFAGVGTNVLNPFTNLVAKAQVGIGFEYLISNNIGIYVYAEDNFVFRDDVDRLIRGKHNDMYYRFGVGLNFYFSRPKTKHNLRIKSKRDKRKRLKTLKEENIEAIRLQKKINKKALREAKKSR